MSAQDELKANGESLVEDIQKNFVPTDDFLRDFAGENERIMKERASLLIASTLNAGCPGSRSSPGRSAVLPRRADG